ncbi:MAG: hypothetical protein ACFHX7_04500 [Pseudomonadota bacterium]
MQVQFETRQVELPARSNSRMSGRISRVFHKFESVIHRLHVTLKDVNGPRGGEDKVCLLRVELKGGGQVVVREQGESLARSIGRCLRRGIHLVSREHKRRLGRRRQIQRLAAVAE